MSKKQAKSAEFRKLTLAAVFSAIIVVFTVVPYTGYINYGLIEITTLHIVTILGAIFLGWKYGAVLGGVWGITCFIRAFTNPLWIMFTNPLISILPRILVGLISGAIFAAMKKLNKNNEICAAITAVAGTLTNTVLVLSAMYVFGGMIKSYAEFFEMFKAIISTIIGVNGVIELIAAVVIISLLYAPLSKQEKRFIGSN